MPGFSVARFLGRGHVYRVGLYGGTEAGKTSLLTALGLGAGRTHPAGYRCVRQTRLSSGKRPAGPPDKWTPEELRGDPVKAFYRGDSWLSEAASRLEAGLGLKGNDTSDPPLLAVYDLVVPGRGQLRVEVTDFAGELLDRDASAAKNAELLTRNLSGVDALLVLAEAPHPGQPTDRLAKDIMKLEAALLDLTRRKDAGPKFPTPVGLVLNKWDRRGRAYAPPGGREVLDFVASSPVHKALHDSLRGAADHVEVFAASAFGQCVTETDGEGRPRPGFDRPAFYPLPSFGLEDPFAWACLKSDELGLRAVLDARPHLLTPARCVSVLRRGNALRKRSPADGPERPAARWATRKALAHLLASVSLVLVAIGLLLSVGQCGLFDAPGHRNVAATLGDTTATPERVADAERWLGDYAASGGIDHWLFKSLWLSRDEAARSVAESRGKRDESRWEACRSASVLADQVSLVPAYLKDFPSGLHRGEAEALWQDLVPRRRRDENRDALDKCRRRYDVARPAPSVPKLEAILNDLDELSRAESDWHAANFGSYSQLRGAVSKQVADIIIEAESSRMAREWAKDQEEFRRHVANGDVGKAASLLKAIDGPKYDGQPMTRREVTALAGDFPAAAQAAVAGAADKAIANRNWQPCRDGLKALLAHNDYLERVPRPAALRGEIARLESDWEQKLYRDYQVTPTAEQARRYRDQAPLQRMRAGVDQYLAWDKAVNSSQTLQLEVSRIEWKGWYNDPAVRVQLDVKRPGSDAWEVHLNETTPSAKNGTGGPLTGRDFIAVPNHAFKYRVTLTAEGGGPYLFSERLTGTVEEDATAVDLIPGREKVALDGRGTAVTVKVLRLEARPPVEPWKE